MWFGILGSLEVRLRDGTPVAVGGPRVRALLALLLLDPGQIVTTERLIDGLYGEDPPAGAANALQSQVSRLRRGLRTGIVEFHPAGYRLAVDPDQVDVHRFGRLAREGGRALSAGDHAQAAELLREALALWRGPALADVADAPFADAQVTRLEELRVAAVEDRVAADLALGRHRDIIAELQELVSAYPLRERPRGLLMRALYGSGRQAEALTLYEETRQVLAEELGADPSAELAAVHMAILRGEPEQTPPAPPAIPEHVSRRLPAQLTSFVGRTAELRRVGKLLDEARLVTLLGPGGTGKTRLAIEAGGREAGEVCFADLAQLSEGTEVPQAVLGALGLRQAGLLSGGEGPAPGPQERLVAALQDRGILLILDNCEHVIAEAAQLAHRLLSDCPGVRILATSREPLGITGEMLRPLPPLEAPPPGTPVEEVMEYPAVRLFADRAAAAQPGFEVTAANADAVLRICAALDGLPLAIELAAARLRALPVEQIVARLNDRFGLLSRGSRTAAPRHQTLRAVVEWSWDLLEEDERILARRLTVFKGGFSLETAQKVSALPEDDVMDLLAGLVEKSLVTVADVLKGGGRRYNMLNTIRTFCAERLAEVDGEEAQVRQAHAHYFLELAETAEPYLRRTEQLEWLARLNTEHDNLHAALRWAVDAGDVRLALQLMAPISSYWLLRGFTGEGAQLSADLLPLIGSEPPGDRREGYAFCVLNAARLGASDVDLRAHLARVESIVYGQRWLFRYPFLNMIWATHAGPPEDPELLAQVATYMAQADPWTQALTRLGTGLQFVMFGAQPASAEVEFTSALAGFRTLGERWGIMMTVGELAALAEQRDDLDAAERLLDEAMDLARALGAMLELADLLCRRAEWRIRAGELDLAEADYQAAYETAVRFGGLETKAQAQHGLGEIARFRGDNDEADRLYEAALSIHGQWFTVEERQAGVYISQGWRALDRDEIGEARALFSRGLTSALRRRNYVNAAAAVDGMAGAALSEGDAEQAALLLGAGAGLRGLPASRNRDAIRIAEGSRAEIGAEPYEEAFQRGNALSLNDLQAMLLPD